MFKYIASVAAAAVTVNATEKKFLSASDALSVQCQAVTTSEYITFDITGLENETNYITFVGDEKLYFNYCAYALMLKPEPWYCVSEQGATLTDVADEAIVSLASTTKRLSDDNGTTTGLTFT